MSFDPIAVDPHKLDIGLSPGAISVKDLGKCYRIYSRPEDRLKQTIIPRIGRIFGPLSRPLAERRYYRDYWALREVSFAVEQGEAFGIIGRNGAGKSTLLQLIAGTLQPTTGSVSVRGRVAALLELGSGFNPEFTGRENVYVNASLFGLHADVVDQRFEDIARFADIGDFIEQPVKTYSSGMMMRLAFAVQIALDPEVIIVDEALSVGDIFFQAKCMNRLRALVDKGVTVLFVSHDVGAIRQFCRRALLLENGVMRMLGTARDVTDEFTRVHLEAPGVAVARAPVAASPAFAVSGAPTASQSAPVRRQEDVEEDSGNVASLPTIRDELLVGHAAFAKLAKFARTGTGMAEIVNMQMLVNGKHVATLDYDETVRLRQIVHFRQHCCNVTVAYKIRTPQGTNVVYGDTRLANQMGRIYEAGRTYLFSWVFKAALQHGSYFVGGAVAHPPSADSALWTILDYVHTALEFRVAPRRDGMIDGLITWPTELEIIEA